MRHGILFSFRGECKICPAVIFVMPDEKKSKKKLPLQRIKRFYALLIQILSVDPRSTQADDMRFEKCLSPCSLKVK